MWYGFDNNGSCRFLSDGEVQEEVGITVVESDVIYSDISQIHLLDGEIIETKDSGQGANIVDLVTSDNSRKLWKILNGDPQVDKRTQAVRILLGGDTDD